MRVLIADTLPPNSVTALRAAGHEVTEALVRGPNLEKTLAMLGPEVLVVRSTKVNRDALNASPSLGLVVRAGAGYDNIDIAAANEVGIFVANCPGRNAHAVAELTIGLMVAMDRHIPEGVQASRIGQWDKGRFAKAQGLCQRTLGIVGLGPIGRLVAKAAFGLDMAVVGWSRSLTTDQARAYGIIRAPAPIDVAAVSDVVTLHVASNRDTQHLADREFFKAMKPGAIFINTTRAGVVDEEALAWAIETKGIRAALDVCTGEPSYKQGSLDWPLAKDERVYLTHHIGASTRQAQEATADETVRIIRTFGETGQVLNCVNMKSQSAATHLLTVRHRDRVGVLASILDIVRSAHLNVQEMENLVFEGQGGAAYARIRLDGSPEDSLVQEVEAQDHVLAVSLISL